MPDSKITALTSISTSTDPANDPLVIVDVSDTSMAATGTTKKVTLNQLLGSGGTATLASATITGDLTVDTSTLKVDSANNRVGIGTSTPAVDLHIQSAGSASAEVRLASATRSYNIGSTGSGYGSANNLIIYDLTGAAERYRLDASGNHFWNNVGGVAGTAMTLNSTGLGVGTTNYIGKIQAAGLVAAADPTFGSSGTFIGAILNNDNTAPGIDLRRWTGAAAIHGTTYISTDYTGNTYFYNGQQSSNTKATSLKLLLNTTGALVFNGGNASANGVGITFPATQVASSDVNTLDDYVEGTFTPVIQGVSTAGTGVYTVQSGRYTKIGNRVFVDIYVNWTAHTGTGAMLIANLPFTIRNASNYYPSVTFGQLNNIALAANSVLTGYGTFNTKTLNLDQYPVGGGATSSVQMDTSGSIVCSVCYEV